MKKMTKRILALLLTVCSLLSVMSPVVFADTGDTSTEPKTVEYNFNAETVLAETAKNTNYKVEAVEGATMYRFGNLDTEGTYNGNPIYPLYEAINEAYDRDNSTLNWKIGLHKTAIVKPKNAVTYFRTTSYNGLRICMSSTTLGDGSKTCKDTWVSFPIDSPDAGTYTFSLSHGLHGTGGMKEVGLYIVSYTGEITEAAVTAALNGTQSQNVSAKLIGTYSCKNSGSGEGAVSDYALENKYAFKEGKNHMIVLKALDEDNSDGLDQYIYISKLALTETEPEPEEDTSAQPQPVDYVFGANTVLAETAKNSEYKVEAVAGQKYYKFGAETDAANLQYPLYDAINEAYNRANSTQNWKIGLHRTALTTNKNSWFRTDNYDGLRMTMKSTTLDDESKTCVGTWVSFPVRNPVQGTYDFRLWHGMHGTAGVKKVGLYVVSYRGSITEDQVTSLLDGGSVSTAEIKCVGTYTCSKETAGEGGYNPSTHAGITMTDAASYTFRDTRKHMIVLKALEVDDSDGLDQYIYISKLALTPSAVQEEISDEYLPEETTPEETTPGETTPVDTVVSPIYNFDYHNAVKEIDPSLSDGGNGLYTNGKLNANVLNNMNAYYAGVPEGSLNWQYVGMKMSDRVIFDNGYGLVASAGVGDWIAFRIKSPGKDTYKLVLDSYATTYGAAASEIYIIPNIAGEPGEEMNAAIQAALVSQNRICSDVSYWSGKNGSANPSKNSAEPVREDQTVGYWTDDGSAKEYILVFRATEQSKSSNKAGKAYLYPAKLELVHADPADIPNEPEDTEPEEPVFVKDPLTYNFDYVTAVDEISTKLSEGGNALYKNGKLVTGVLDKMNSYYAGVPEGSLNWTLAGMKMTGDVTFDKGYCMVAASGVDDWIAFRIKAPAAGDYQLCLDYYGTNYGATNSAVYIIPSVTDVADMNAYIEAALVDEYLVGDKISYWKSGYGSYSPGKQQAETLVEDFPVGMWSSDGSASEYIVVFKALAQSATESRAGKAHMYPEELTFRPAANALPQNFESVVALQDAVSAPTCQVAITSVVNGHDYIYMFLKGSKLWVYDLDTKELMDSEESVFGTPRGAVVDANGIVWACGAARYLYRYDPFTGIGEQIPFTVAAEGGVTSFNALGITTDENGMIYFGSYNRGNLFMYNPQNGEFTNLSGWLDATPDDGLTSDVLYAGQGGLVVRDGYIYCGVDGDVNADHIETHAVVKFSIAERRVVDTLDLTECWGAGVYFGYMNMVGDYLLCGSDSVLVKTMAVDISGEKMKLVELDGDMKAGFSGFVSGELNGKLYCLGNTKQEQGMFEIDPDSMYVKELNKSFFPYSATKLKCWGDSVVTVEQGIKLKGESLITYYNDTASQSVDLIFYNPKTKFTVTWDDFTGDKAAGNQLQALITSPDGKKIYAGSYGSNYLTEYDVYEEKVTRSLQTYDHQIDELLWYNGYVYSGNYQSCTITQIDPKTGTTRPLFAIKNTAFNQYRMHALAAGDGKVFGGTIPSSNRWGGVLVWYDFEQDLTYVAAGPNPEDVYYCDTSYAVNNNRWKSAVTHELAEFSIDILDPSYDPENPPNAVELYANIEVDGKIVQRFNGVIENQCINSMVYKDGYIYGSTTTHGGSGTNPLSPPEGIEVKNACLFVYDVAAMKVVATYDLCDTIEGLKTPVQFVESIQEDPLVDGKFWGAVSNTLFSYTFDHATNTFHVTEELSFGKASYNHGGDNYCGREIVFDGNYMYVSFGDAGVYMINRNDVQDCVRLSVDVPKHMVLAADGNLYYIDGGFDVKMLEVNSYTQPIVASNFQPLLDSLPEEVTAENADYVNRISKAYEALSDVATVATDPTRLVAAEEKAAAIIQAQLDEGIPSILHTSDIPRIRALRYTYEKLSGRIQALLSTYNLICAEQVLGIYTGKLNSYTGDNAWSVFFVGLAISAGALLTLLYYRKRKYARK